MKDKDLYIGILKNSELEAVLSLDTSNVTTSFFDEMHDNGYEIKTITKDEYDTFDLGDEISLDDLINGNYRTS